MAKWFAPVIGIMAKKVVDTDAEVYTYYKNPTENPRPNVDLTLANFTDAGYVNDTSHLLCLIRGVYDESDGSYWQRTEYLSQAAGKIVRPGVDAEVPAAGMLLTTDAAGLNMFKPGGGGEHTMVVRPNSVATTDTCVYLPFALFSPSNSLAGFANSYGCNGNDGGNGVEYRGQGKALGSATGLAPLQNNIARNISVYLAPDLSVFDYAAPDSCALCGNTVTNEMTSIGGKSLRFTPGATGWFAPGIGRSISNKMTSVHLPALAEMHPGDVIPLAMLLLGRNRDGQKIAADLGSIPPSVLSSLVFSLEFSKVDQVPSDVEGSIFEGHFGWTQVG